jgi:hypothetical protein
VSDVVEAVTEITVGGGTALSAYVRQAFLAALAEQSRIDPAVLHMNGMSGRKYRRFINNLVGALSDARYLEIGSWAGSTLCSAINRNNVRALAIDNWSEFGGPRDEFLDNVGRFRTPGAQVNLIESDFREVDYTQLGPFNLYLFDGPHAAEDQYDGLRLVLPALDREFVLVVDDWNWSAVRSGTFRAIAELRVELEYVVEIRSTLDDTHPEIAFADSDWHNGYFISVLRQPG